MNRSLVLALACAALASCSAPQFTVAPSLGRFEPEGDVSYIDTTQPLPATLDNSVEDLDLAESENTLGVRADFKFGLPHLTLSTQASSWDGNGTLNADFGGIPASTAVDTELDLALHRLALTFDVLPSDMFELGLGFGVTVADVEAQVTDSGNTLTESADEIAPLPVLALRAGVRVWRLDFEALLSGMSIDYDGDEATYLEADLNAKLALFGAPGSANGSLVVGWRQIDLDVEYDDGDAAAAVDLSFSGPYFGLQLGL